MSLWVIICVLCILSGFPPLVIFGIVMLIVLFVFRNR